MGISGQANLAHLTVLRSETEIVMNTEINTENKKRKMQEKEEKRKLKKQLKRKKKNALVICRDGKQYWTTQDQFWQWVRDKTVIRTGHNPLQGAFVKENEEKNVVISNTILNLSCPNHLREALYSRRYRTN